MIARRVNAPLAHGVGRYFDAFGALVLERPQARYEGQIALEWNLIADSAATGRYEFIVRRDVTPWQLDLRPMVRQVVSDLIAGRPASLISARFHDTMAAATVELVGAARQRFGRLPVVLTGGCFQNARLAESVRAGLRASFSVHLHSRVPPGDGGIALGQAVVADAMVRGGVANDS